MTVEEASRGRWGRQLQTQRTERLISKHLSLASRMDPINGSVDAMPEASPGHRERLPIDPRVYGGLPMQSTRRCVSIARLIRRCRNYLRIVELLRPRRGEPTRESAALGVAHSTDASSGRHRPVSCRRYCGARASSRRMMPYRWACQGPGGCVILGVWRGPGSR